MQATVSLCIVATGPSCRFYTWTVTPGPIETPGESCTAQCDCPDPTEVEYDSSTQGNCYYHLCKIGFYDPNWHGDDTDQ